MHSLVPFLLEGSWNGSDDTVSGDRVVGVGYMRVARCHFSVWCDTFPKRLWKSLLGVIQFFLAITHVLCYVTGYAFR